MAALVLDVARSPLLDEVEGLVHGFTTRALGSMAGSVHPAEEQAGNRERLARRLGMPLVKVRQVHGRDVALVEGGRVVRLRDGRSAEASDQSDLEADALITRDRRAALAVAVADCAPVLLVTPSGWIGIAHAGWQGTALGVVRALCEALLERGASLRDARAAIGPAIGVCCYKIDGLRADALRRALGDNNSNLIDHGGEFAFDLLTENGEQVASFGISSVDVLNLCTKDEVATFFSHRGEEGRAGRGLAFLGWDR